MPYQTESVMSKKSAPKKTRRKPVTVRIELTLADIEIVLKAFAHVIDGSLPDSAWIDRLMNIEMKFLNAPSASRNS
jgi:hypothetical protein